MATKHVARVVVFSGRRTFGALHPSSRPFSSEDPDKYVVKPTRPAIDIPKVPLHEFVWAGIDKWSDKIALECGVTGRKYTYSAARDLSHRIAAALRQSFKLKSGESFAVLSPNLPEYPLILLAAAEAGLVASTINPLYTPDEIAKQIKDCSAKLIFTVPAFYDNAAAALNRLGLNIPIVVIKDSQDAQIPKGSVLLDDVVSQKNWQLPHIDYNVEDNVVLPYSSGTTGLPKGVQLTNHNIGANLRQIDSPLVRLLLETTPTQQDTVLGLLPMFHIYGMTVVSLSCLQGGGRLVTVPRFEPKLFIDSLVRHEVGLLYLVPPLILFLGGHPDVKPEHLKFVRTTNSGAAPMGAADVQRFRQRAEHIVMIQGYGMTETSPVTLTSDQNRWTKYASTGIPLPNTLHKVVDVETGNSLPANKLGELYIKGPHVMKGYLNREDANEDIFRDGWLRTGDLVQYDDEGDFYIVDRLKELIKVKGFQVAPAELEEILRAHPKIADAAVIGVNDKRSGEAPRAFVVAKEGHTISPADVAAYVASQVAEYKQLTGGVHILPVIPKSAAGKILRKELRARYGD